MHSKEIIADVDNLPDEKLIWLNGECSDEYLPEDVKVVEDSGSNMFRATQNEGSSLQNDEYLRQEDKDHGMSEAQKNKEGSIENDYNMPVDEGDREEKK